MRAIRNIAALWIFYKNRFFVNLALRRFPAEDYFVLPLKLTPPEDACRWALLASLPLEFPDAARHALRRASDRTRQCSHPQA
jgi:hypothetical protein